MPTVETNGIQTYYERAGAGPPLVLLHGATSDHQLWQHQAEALSDDYEVITYDMRGHGRTGGSDLPRYTIDLYADDLHALVATLDLDAPYVGGLSMGGMTALTYAARYTNDLSALIAAGARTPEPQTLKESAVMSVLLPVTTKLGSVIGHERIQSGMAWVYERIADEDTEDLTATAEELRDDEIELDPDEREKIMDAGHNYRNAPLLLENISVPTLILYGETEPFIRQHLPVYRRRLSDVTVKEIPDAGHTAHIQNPEAFTAAVREFLQTVE